MSQSELLKKVAAVLEASGTPYMLTGSYASGLQGEPRSTHDIDFVVDLTPRAASTILDEFKQPAFYLDAMSVSEAITRRSQFNLIEVATGVKVDFWLLTDDPFNRCRFDRRYLEDFEGRPLYVSRPEDTILMKLRWAEMCGGSEKQFNDARGVYELQIHLLDLPYMERWATELDVYSEWERLKREADPLPSS